MPVTDARTWAHAADEERARAPVNLQHPYRPACIPSPRHARETWAPTNPAKPQAARRHMRSLPGGGPGPRRKHQTFRVGAGTAQASVYPGVRIPRGRQAAGDSVMPPDTRNGRWRRGGRPEGAPRPFVRSPTARGVRTDASRSLRGRFVRGRRRRRCPGADADAPLRRPKAARSPAERF
ncbi:hypothetical protein VTO73DRAFT_14710 [Trametes versicolor]